MLIIICDNTDIAELFFRKISGEEERYADDIDDDDEDVADAVEAAPRRRKGKRKVVVYGTGDVFPDLLSNTKEHPLRTIRIDSKLLEEAESRVEAGSRTDAAEKLREIVATVGRAGQPGEQVRCVVSVQMLAEGWDANNVTHILMMGQARRSCCRCSTGTSRSRIRPSSISRRSSPVLRLSAAISTKSLRIRGHGSRRQRSLWRRQRSSHPTPGTIISSSSSRTSTGSLHAAICRTFW